jgi:hypothetical protein
MNLTKKDVPSFKRQEKKEKNKTTQICTILLFSLAYFEESKLIHPKLKIARILWTS